MKHRRSAFRMIQAAVIAGLFSAAPDAAQQPDPFELTQVHQKDSWFTTQLAAYRKFPRLDLAFRLIKEGRNADAERELARLLAQDPGDLKAGSVYLVLLSQRRDYDGVLRVSDGLLRQHPLFSTALLYSGMALQSQGKNELARRDFVRLAGLKSASKSDRIFALDTVAELALSAKRYDQVLRASNLLTAYKQDARLYYRQGIAHQSIGQIKDATAAFGKGLTLAREPEERAPLLRALGDLSLEQKNWSRAVECYRSALELEPDDTALLRQSAHALFEIRSYAQASQTMRHLLSLQPESTDRLWLANALVAQGKKADAELEFRKVVTETRDNAERIAAYRSLIELVRERQGNAEAIRLSKTLLELQDSEENRRTLLALIEGQKDYTSMIAELQIIIARRSESPAARYEAYMKLGNVYDLLHQDENAAGAFQGALRIYRRTEALTGLAQVRERTGQTAEAIRLKEEALQLTPSAELHLSLGVLLDKAGRGGEAIAHLDAAAAGPGTPPETIARAYAQEGYIYSGLHRYKEAREAFERALGARDGSDPDVNAAVGRVCIELGDYRGSLPYLEKAQAVRPDVDLLRLSAWARVQAGDLDGGAALYVKLLPLYRHPSPEAEQAGVALARLEAGRGNFTAASEHLVSAFADSGDKHPELLAEAAQDAFQGHQWSSTVALYGRYSSHPNTTPAQRQAAWESVGYACMNAGDYLYAVTAFRRVLENGKNDALAHRNLAFALYRLKDWKASLEEFLTSLRTEEDTQAMAGAARCYQELNKPGLAIHYLNQVAGKSDSTAEKKNMLNELAYLHEEVHEYAAAAKTLRELLSSGADASIGIRLARNLRLSGQIKEAGEAIEAVRTDNLSMENRVALLDERGAILNKSGDLAQAARALNEADRMEPAAWREYQLGLNEMAQRNAAGALPYFKAALAKEPDNLMFLSAIAYGNESAGNQREAAQTFRELADRDAGNTQWLKSLAYTDLRLSRNREAADWFRKVIDKDSAAAGKADFSPDDYPIRSEIGRLTDNYDVTFYHGYAGQTYTGTGAIDLIGGNVFAAPSGFEASWQPPRFGLRNGRSLQVFGRVYWEDGNNSLTFDTKHYQASAGVRYKPFASQNLWLSAEEIFHRTDPLLSGRWLTQILYSWNPGFEMRPGRSRWNYTLAFSDSAFTPGGYNLFAQYAEFRRGISFNFRNSWLVTPHVVADGRWQSADSDSGAYIEAGAGVSLRYLFRQNRYETQRSSFEIVFQCKRGNFFLDATGFGGCSALGILRFR